MTARHPPNLRSVSAVRERLADVCLELLQIPSVTGHEADITAHLHRWAQAQPGLGHDDTVRYGNALVLGNPDSRRPCVALVGHTDTVPPHAGDPPAHRDGDRLVGLGASDMKGSVAVMQVLMEQLDLAALPFSLMVVLYDREEGPYADNGLQPLLERFEQLQEVDLAIAMEPTDGTLQLGCMGGIQAKVTFEGRSAHSARPWQGDNAIHKAGPFITEMRNRPVRDVDVEGLRFREATSITLAHGGRARNVVPDRFELGVNVRFAPRSPLGAATQAHIDELRRLAQGAKVDIVDVAPPGPVPVNNPILNHLQGLARLPVEPKQAWTDVARLAAHGIDAVNFGPGMGDQAHQAGEWISLDAMTQAYEILTRMLTVPLAA